MKIYTKTGDKGKTSLLSGNRVEKYHIRLESYGTVDELNSFIGMLRSFPFNENCLAFLLEVQNNLFNIGSNLALDENKYKIEIPQVTDNDIRKIETEIDSMQNQLPELKHFILPGGSQLTALCHICRTICRRAERRIVELSDRASVDEKIIIYFNRLSDYFFVLSRYLAKETNTKEMYWIGKKDI